MFRRLLTVVLSVLLIFPAPGFVWAQGKTRVAVLDPSGDAVPAATAEFLGEFWRQEVANDSRLELIREKNPCRELGCVVDRGSRIGADRVVWGTIDEVEAEYRLRLFVAEVGLARNVLQREVRAPSEDDLFVRSGEFVAEFLSTLALPVTEGAPPNLQHRPVTAAPVGSPVRIVVEAPELGRDELYAMFQVVGSSRLRFTRLRPESGSTYSSEIPASAMQAAGVRYYLRVTDANGRELTRYPSTGWWTVEALGSGEAPVSSGETAGSDRGRGQADRAPGSSGDRGRGTDQSQQSNAAGDRNTGSNVERASAEDGDEGSRRRWLWIGAGVAALGGLAAVLFGGGDDGGGDPVGPGGGGAETLPEPPEHQ